MSAASGGPEAIVLVGGRHDGFEVEAYTPMDHIGIPDEVGGQDIYIRTEQRARDGRTIFQLAHPGIP